MSALINNKAGVSNTTGTGDPVLDVGASVNGHGLIVGNVPTTSAVPYYRTNADKTLWEDGECDWNATTRTLENRVISDSSASGAAVTFTGETSVYFTANVNAVADMENKTEGATKKILTQAERDAITANTAKVSNATHTGDVTGSGALTISSTAITGKPLVTAASADHVLIADASDSDNLKKVQVSDLTGGGGGGTEFADDVFRVQDSVDATKEIALDASDITTGQTRELTVPDISMTVGKMHIDGPRGWLDFGQSNDIGVYQTSPPKTSNPLVNHWTRTNNDMQLLGEWDFNTSTGSGDPGADRFSMNSATLASVTSIEMANTPLTHSQIQLDDFTTSDELELEVDGDSTKRLRVSISNIATNGGTHYTFTVAHVSNGGTLFASGDDVRLVRYVSGSTKVGDYLPATGSDVTSGYSWAVLDPTRATGFNGYAGNGAASVAVGHVGDDRGHSGFGWCERIAEETGYSQYLINIAAYGATVDTFIAGGTTTVYDVIEAQVAAAIAALPAGVTIGGVLWRQGENDTARNPFEYEIDLDAFRDYLIGKGWITDSTPVHLFQQAGDYTWPGLQVFNDNTNNAVKLISTRGRALGLSGADILHFDGNDNYSIGYDAAGDALTPNSNNDTVVSKVDHWRAQYTPTGAMDILAGHKQGEFTLNTNDKELYVLTGDVRGYGQWDYQGLGTDTNPGAGVFKVDDATDATAITELYYSDDGITDDSSITLPGSFVAGEGLILSVDGENKWMRFTADTVTDNTTYVTFSVSGMSKSNTGTTLPFTSGDDVRLTRQIAAPGGARQGEGATHDRILKDISRAPYVDANSIAYHLKSAESYPNGYILQVDNDGDPVIQFTHDGEAVLGGDNNAWLGSNVFGSVAFHRPVAVAGNIATDSSFVIASQSSAGIKIGNNLSSAFGWQTVPCHMDWEDSGLGSVHTPTITAYYGFNTAREFDNTGGTDPQSHFYCTLPHDYLPGSDVEIAINYSSDGTDTTGEVRFDLFGIVILGHTQHGTAPQGIAIDVDVVPNQTGQKIYRASTTLAFSTFSNLEVGALIRGALTRMTPGGTNNTGNIHVLGMEIDYKSTNIATKNRTPNFYT